MDQVDQNINKDMFESDLIDVESMDFSDDQTWLCAVPGDSGCKLDIIDWGLSCDWPINEDDDYRRMEQHLNSILDAITKSQIVSAPDKHKFDSRTFVKPKKRFVRPSIQNIIEVPSNHSSMSPHHSLNHGIGSLNHTMSGLNPTMSALNPTMSALNPTMSAMSPNSSVNKYLTYNKYNSPLGPIGPMLRLKTFNVDTNSENSNAVKQYAMKRRSLVHDDDPQLEDMDMTQMSETSGRLTMEHMPSKPINIDLSQPAHNLHNTFNKGLANIINERGSLNMYQSGESLMRMSPPSLVSSLLMDSSGTFNPESLEGRKSMSSHKDSGIPPSGRDSIDPMMTSMTLSILDEKDMSTSFLSQTTYPDNDSLIDSLPPSLVSSVNSSYVVSSKPRDSDVNIFSSATFTHLEQSEKLLSARPRCKMYNSITKRDSSIRNSESYTKAREQACQIECKVLNENSDKKESPKPKVDMMETITLHSNNKFRDAEKENFERDDAFYNDMGLARPDDSPRNTLNATLGKQELNEIIQARQKLSLARKGLPSEPDKLPNQTDDIKTIQLPNQIITVPKQSIENASELLARRRAMNGFEREEREQPSREAPKRNATFKMANKPSAMETTVVYMKDPGATDANIIDINSATMNLLGDEKTLKQDEWCAQERAMVGSSESIDTATFSSSSPPDSVPDAQPNHYRNQIASTPLALRVGVDPLNISDTLSPILDDNMVNISPLHKTQKTSPMERTYDMHNATVINSGTIIKKSSVKRDILTVKSAENKAPSQMRPPSRVLSSGSSATQMAMAPPSGLPKKTGLPTSKLRQYSSHRELNRIPGPTAVPAVRAMVRRTVYASNPALSPTTPHAPSLPVPHKEEEKPSRPTLTNPPPLVRQGTETLRRERPQSHLVAPRDLRVPSSVPVSMRTQHFMPPPVSRPYSVVGVTQLRVSTTRPASGPVVKSVPVTVTDQPRPSSTSTESRLSALPRPSRLPAPRRALRPPSVYSTAPMADTDHY